MTDHEPEDACVTARDALQMAQRAQARLTDLEQQNEEFQDELASLRREVTAANLRLSEIDDSRAYEDLDVDTKVGMVREHAFQKAVDRGGPTTLDYNGVVYEVFDGKASADHAYKLMRLAADHPGFEYFDADRSSPKPKRLKCDPDAAKAAPAFSSANKAIQEGSE